MGGSFYAWVGGRITKPLQFDRQSTFHLAPVLLYYVWITFSAQNIWATVKESLKQWYNFFFSLAKLWNGIHSFLLITARLKHSFHLRRPLVSFSPFWHSAQFTIFSKIYHLLNITATSKTDPPWIRLQQAYHIQNEYLTNVTIACNSFSFTEGIL